MESHAEAAMCFQQALAVARDQEALGLELRAAVSVARLEHIQGRTIEARAILEPVCRRVTEGFDSPDYREAAALLKELA
jgi:predicted ATPase